MLLALQRRLVLYHPQPVPLPCCVGVGACKSPGDILNEPDSWKGTRWGSDWKSQLWRTAYWYWAVGSEAGGGKRGVKPILVILLACATLEHPSNWADSAYGGKLKSNSGRDPRTSPL
jgi:hypothetical protein